MLKKIFFIIGLVFSSTAYAQPTAPCTSTVKTGVMDSLFYQSLAAMHAKNKAKVVILPFYDASQVDFDETLSRFFLYSFYEFIQLHNPKKVLHPYLVLEEIEKRNLPSKALFNKDQALPIAQALGADWLVMGMFQKQPPDQVRFFVHLIPVKNNQRPVILEYTSPLNNRFFSVLTDAYPHFKKVLKLKKRDKKITKTYLASRPSFASYRYYVKGMDFARFYDREKLDIAKVWFERAYNLSYRFHLAQTEKIRVLLMSALLRKQKGKKTTDLNHEIQKTIRDLDRQDVNAFKRLSYLNRWLQGEQEFILGLSYFQNQDYKNAVKKFGLAHRWLLEDGLNGYYLVEALSKINSKKVNEIRPKVFLINPLTPCF